MKLTMTTLPTAMLWGGLATGLLAIAELTLFSAAIDLESLIKYGGGFALFVFAVGRYFQKIEDKLEKHAAGFETLHENQKNIRDEIAVMQTAVTEIQTHCKNCNGLKPKTDFDKRHIEIDTPKV